MVAPGLTESGVSKVKDLIVMVASLLPASEADEPEDDAEDDADDEELDVEPEDDEEPDEPQATRPAAHRVATASRTAAWVLDMSRSPLWAVGCVGRWTATCQDPAVRPGAGVRLRRAPYGRRAVAVRRFFAALDQVRRGKNGAAEPETAGGP
jgi:hypothetical protein